MKNGVAGVVFFDARFDLLKDGFNGVGLCCEELVGPGILSFEIGEGVGVFLAQEPGVRVVDISGDPSAQGVTAGSARGGRSHAVQAKAHVQVPS
jgi:hypothetical protein